MPPREPGAPVLLAAIAGAHGVRGLVKVKPFTEIPENVAAYGPLSDEAGRRYALTLKGKAKGDLLAAIEGVNDRDAAQALKGTRLYVDRANLPPVEDDDEFYMADLIGLEAQAPDGRGLGRVINVVNHGAGDILEIEPRGSATILVPFTREAVPEVDVANGRLVVDWPDDE
ncbi:MAG: ribosome maturation factor RimM [Alphaproteobacteria bacterium]